MSNSKDFNTAPRQSVLADGPNMLLYAINLSMRAGCIPRQTLEKVDPIRSEQKRRLLSATIEQALKLISDVDLFDNNAEDSNSLSFNKGGGRKDGQAKE
jgi:hypothetical protein